MRRVQVFDVNETLLDLAAMDPARPADLRRPCHGRPGDGRRPGWRDLADDDKQAVTAQLRQLPAHPEVLGALRRLASLTNLTKQVARAQLEVDRPGIIGAGLAEVADAILATEGWLALQDLFEVAQVAGQLCDLVDVLDPGPRKLATRSTRLPTPTGSGVSSRALRSFGVALVTRR